MIGRASRRGGAAPKQPKSHENEIGEEEKKDEEQNNNDTNSNVELDDSMRSSSYHTSTAMVPFDEAFLDAQEGLDVSLAEQEGPLDRETPSNNEEHVIDREEVSTSAAAPAATTPPVQAEESTNNDNNNNNNNNDTPPRQPALFKSTRFKGYLTILLGSIIYYDAAQKSRNAFAAATVPATARQSNYALTVASVSMAVAGGALGAHLDQITPLENFWKRTFAPKSRVELVVALFLFFWWVAAVGWQTSIQGLAGDGKGQYSLYYSSWVCLYSAFFGVLEPWWVAAGWSSLQAFVQSWPFRSPGWLCLLFVAGLDLVWILDLWRNYNELRERNVTVVLYYYLEAVPTGQWQFLVSLSVFTIVASAAWVVVEIFRGSTPEGTLTKKARYEVITEGMCILVLLTLWIPSIMLVTTSGGLASLVGNAYFFSWGVVIFLAETAIWFVHDLREGMHQSLLDKENEYKSHQRDVLEKQQAFLRNQLHKKYVRQQEQSDEKRDDDDGQSSVCAPEFFDSATEF